VLQTKHYNNKYYCILLKLQIMNFIVRLIYGILLI
jgi:hypothetical protein